MKKITILAIAMMTGPFSGLGHEALVQAYDGSGLTSISQLKKMAGQLSTSSGEELLAPELKVAKADARPMDYPFKWLAKYPQNPILRPRPLGNNFESHGTFNPSVILKDGIFHMLYRAQNNDSVSTIGLAVSGDGINFTKRAEPVIKPEYDYELPGGCEDPRIMQVGTTYYLTYTGYGSRGTPSCLATSADLINWKKHGCITPAKSAAILNVPVSGKYWLYFGDTNMWAAYSPDLVNWTVVGKPVMEPRSGSWDDALVEPGPPPILTKQGILLIYNGNLSEGRARELGRQKHRDQVREYNTGWALFDKDDPTKLIARCDSPFLTVTESYEIYGQVGDVVFTEGMVIKDGKAYVYYGAADTVIGVAIGEVAWEEP